MPVLEEDCVDPQSADFDNYSDYEGLNPQDVPVRDTSDTDGVVFPLDSRIKAQSYALRILEKLRIPEDFAAVASSDQQLTYCFPVVDLATGSNVDWEDYVYPSWRLVHFEDGEEVVGWCTCSEDQQSLGGILHGSNFDNYLRSYIAEIPRPCLHLLAIKVNS